MDPYILTTFQFDTIILTPFESCCDRGASHILSCCLIIELKTVDERHWKKKWSPSPLTITRTHYDLVCEREPAAGVLERVDVHLDEHIVVGGDEFDAASKTAQLHVVVGLQLRGDCHVVHVALAATCHKVLVGQIYEIE